MLSNARLTSHSKRQDSKRWTWAHQVQWELHVPGEPHSAFSMGTGSLHEHHVAFQVLFDNSDHAKRAH
eukprot:3756197-Amphidinium_carterae.1